MKWDIPPIIKIYEALGAFADGRVEVEGSLVKVYSSSRNKFYDVEYDPKSASIMTNDNGSYWKGYLGYPAIAYLMTIKVLTYNSDLCGLLHGIAWKDINTKFKNNFEKSLDFILKDLSKVSREELEMYAQDIQAKIVALNLNLLGAKKLPPEGY